MTFSNLTNSHHALMLELIEVLEGEGYVYDDSHTSFNAYLASALQGISGSSSSNLTMSRGQLVAGLANALGFGPVSNLTSNSNQMSAVVANSSGGSSPPPTSTPTFYLYGF